MALPPTLPTSFVPHSVSATPRRFRTDLTSAFGFFSYMILAIVFALAIGVFFYGRILSAEQFTKDAALTKAESSIDPETVDSFVRLRDRLASGETLLVSHTAFSGFFSSLGTIMPATIRFSSLHLSISDSGAIKIEGSGTAKSFNALAAVSTAFAHDGRIKDAIFSNITINAKDNSVSFELAATLDPKAVTFSP